MDSDMQASYRREESDAARLDRNYGELLQELRVAETGVQLLFAFLLSIAFQSRFPTLTTFEKTIYVFALIFATLAAVLLIAPVSGHRIWFRQRLKDELVEWTARLATAGLAFLALAVLSAILLVVHVVVGPLAAGLITAAVGVVTVWLWYIRPLRGRRRTITREAADR